MTMIMLMILGRLRLGPVSMTVMMIKTNIMASIMIMIMIHVSSSEYNYDDDHGYDSSL